MSDISAELPQEIISEILLRLPVKSIGRSRCVSKVWLSLLTSYEFIKAHVAHHTHFAHEQLLLHSNGRHSLFNLTLHLGGNHLKNLEFFDQQVRTLVGSCNGLVLVETAFKVLCLINCLTQEYVKLPDLPSGFDPQTNFSSYGFGYDSLSDDYKIVCISARRNDKGNTFVDIYSLKMRSWKRFGTCPYDLYTLDDNSCVFVDGALHWARLPSSDNESLIIVAFDLSFEKFNEIPAPASIDYSESFFGNLMVIDGCLGIAVELFLNVFAEIWFMKRYASVESWTKLVIHMELKIFWSPYCFHRGKLLFEEADGVLKWYYLQDGRVEVCLAEDDDTHADGTLPFIDGITYVESLVSPRFQLS